MFDKHYFCKTLVLTCIHYLGPYVYTLACCSGQSCSLTLLESSKLKGFADNNFKLNENGRKFSEWEENTAISPFPTVFSKDLYCRHVKTRVCLGLFGKGLKNCNLYYTWGNPDVDRTMWLIVVVEFPVTT